jgi:hypothetical protein
MASKIRPSNLCVACSKDFASVAAFDRHRTGTHEYDFAQGLRFDIPREDGRRCMDEDEMIEVGMELDPRGRWRIHKDAERIQAWATRQAA